MKNGSDLDAEIFVAGPAVEALRFVSGPVVDVERFAERAVNAGWPALFDEPFLGGLVGGKSLDDFHESDASTVGFTWSAETGHSSAFRS